MTVAATVRKAGPTPGNSLATVFPFAFKVFLNTDIAVDLTVIATGIVTRLVLNDPLGYTVALNPDQNANPGGSITYNPAGVPMPATQQLTITSIVPLTQGTHIINGGAFFANNIEDAIDHTEINVQDLAALISACVRFPLADSSALNATLPPAAQRANLVLGFDALGNVIVTSGGSNTPISGVWQAVVQAATLALGRAAMGFGAFFDTLIGAANKAAFLALITPLTTKGDLWNFAAADTRLPVGVDGTVLAADSTQASGLKYVNLDGGAVRQSALAGVVDANGFANMLTVGAGLRPGLSATATPLVLAMAAGFGARGAQDLISVLSADVADILGANLPISNTSAISADYVSAAAVTWAATLALPQYGYAFDRTKGAILQMGGANNSTVFLDDYGNTWTRQGGAKVTTSYSKFGTGAMGGGGATNAMDGATDYVKSANFTQIGVDGSWAMRAWVKPLNALPGAGGVASIIAMMNAGSFGASLEIYNNGGTIRFAYGLSSTGAALDIAAHVQGTTLPVLGTEYFVELTYDALAGVYRLYVNGAQEASTASALRVCLCTAAAVGAYPTATGFWQGYIAGAEIRPYCDHPNGTAYAVPTGVPSVTDQKQSWFSIPEMKMYEVSGASVAAGANPAMTAKNRVFVGEADTSGAAVTAVRNYALRGQYVSGWAATPGVSTVAAKNHLIGVREHQEIAIDLMCVSPDAGNGNTVGEIFFNARKGDTAYNSPIEPKSGRCTCQFTTGPTNAFVVLSSATGQDGATGTSYNYRVRARRSF